MARKPGSKHDSGPPIIDRNGTFCYDLRRWGGPRYMVARDPAHPRWPKKGRKAASYREADGWKWEHADWAGSRSGRSRAEKGTLKAGVDAYLALRARIQAPNTHANDASFFRKHLVPALGEQEMLDLTAESFQKVFNRLVDEGYAASTLGQYRQQLSGFFRWLGGPNPAKEVQLPKAAQTDPYIFDDGALGILRAAADDLSREHRVLLEAAVATGARKGELGALHTQTFDRKRFSVRILQQTDDSGRLRALKGKRARTAFVLPEWWAFHAEARKPFVLGGSKPWPAWKVYRMLKQVYEAAGFDIEGVGVHALRHTYARICLERPGFTLDMLQIFLGHASIKTTQQSYGHLKEDAALRMAQEAFLGTK